MFRVFKISLETILDKYIGLSLDSKSSSTNMTSTYNIKKGMQSWGRSPWNWKCSQDSVQPDEERKTQKNNSEENSEDNSGEDSLENSEIDYESDD